jgi:hypothetical protein
VATDTVATASTFAGPSAVGTKAAGTFKATACFLVQGGPLSHHRQPTP